MRLLLPLVFAFSIFISTAFAQDPGAMAAQQASMAAAQASQQANAQAMQASQLANQQAMQNAQLTLDTCPQCARTQLPKFSIAGGAYPSEQVVRLTTKSRSAHIFYTTDGWTPTTSSIPYTGPITIAHSELVQAIAVSPGAARSSIATAQYTIASPSPLTDEPAPKQVSANDIELPQDTALPLVFIDKLDSQTAAVGDPVALALASDLVVNGHVIAIKGTPAHARVSAVDPAGRMSVPGSVAVTFGSININGVEVHLSGTRTKEGSAHPGRQLFLLIPGIGPASLLKKGDPVEIAPNTPVTALIAGNTEIPASP